ncbi:MAG: DNA repair protein RecN [Gemmatimonadota bacterium]
MLLRLRVSALALIEDVTLEFGPGLNVLTGETGAGKSILVDSLGLLLGARASAGLIRAGADRAVIEGLFSEPGEETVLRREILRDRSNRCFIDGGLATAGMLQERGARWVALHGQHEDQLLLKPATQRALLDAFAGADELAARVARDAGTLAALDRERAALAEAEADRTVRLAFCSEQAAEIEAAQLDPDEEASLEAQALTQRHATERQRLAGEVTERLAGEEFSAIAVLAGLGRPLDRLAALDAAAADWPGRLTEVRVALEELARDLAHYADGVELDPARLAELEERRDLLYRLKRKHGSTVEAVMQRGAELAAERDALQADDQRSAGLEGERGAVFTGLAAAAGELAAAREAAADQLEAAVRERLAALGMAAGALRVELARRADCEGIPWNGERWAWSAAGLEEVRFLLAPNAGEAPRPLAQIASGGELSRALLAVKAAVAAVDQTPTLIFDEIDAGIGGIVAHHVAGELRAVSQHHQVIVVTHLAQIAAVADRHLVVEKTADGARSVTTVREVAGDERVREVSRLLGGDPEREASRHHAADLLAGRPDALAGRA